MTGCKHHSARRENSKDEIISAVYSLSLFSRTLSYIRRYCAEAGARVRLPMHNSLEVELSRKVADTQRRLWLATLLKYFDMCGSALTEVFFPNAQETEPG